MKDLGSSSLHSSFLHAVNWDVKTLRTSHGATQAPFSQEREVTFHTSGAVPAFLPLGVFTAFLQEGGPAASAAHTCFWMEPAGSAASHVEVQEATGTHVLDPAQILRLKP